MAPKTKATVPEDQLDEDVKSMKSTDLIQALKALKALGVKTNVSGNLAQLKQLLHTARRDPSAPAATGTAPTTPSAGGDTEDTSGKPSDTLLVLEDVHPITKDCLDKLGEIKQVVTAKDVSGGTDTVESDLGLLLQPVSKTKRGDVHGEHSHLVLRL